MPPGRSFIVPPSRSAGWVPLRRRWTSTSHSTTAKSRTNTGTAITAGQGLPTKGQTKLFGRKLTPAETCHRCQLHEQQSHGPCAIEIRRQMVYPVDFLDRKPVLFSRIFRLAPPVSSLEVSPVSGWTAALFLRSWRVDLKRRQKTEAQW